LQIDNDARHFSYTSLYGYFAGSSMITYLADLIIFLAIITYFICAFYKKWRDNSAVIFIFWLGRVSLKADPTQVKLSMQIARINHK
jgi:hypothetical protein